MTKKSVSERFWEKVKQSEDCWEWQACTHEGYGSFWYRGRAHNAQRIAYELAVGPIPDGMYVCHRCNNKRCCNPEHLYLGTNAENLADAKRDGLYHLGERDGVARLTEEDVRAIRTRWRPWDRKNSMRAIARDYGVSYSTVNAVLTERTWSHVA